MGEATPALGVRYFNLKAHKRSTAALAAPGNATRIAVRNGSAIPQERAVRNLYAESWHNLFRGAFVISRRSPELDPVEARRGFFARCMGGHPDDELGMRNSASRSCCPSVKKLTNLRDAALCITKLGDVRCCSHTGLNSDIAPCPSCAMKRPIHRGGSDGPAARGGPINAA